MSFHMKMLGVEVNWSAKVKYLDCYTSVKILAILILMTVSKNGMVASTISCPHWVNINTN